METILLPGKQVCVRRVLDAWTPCDWQADVFVAVVNIGCRVRQQEFVR
jgi:hypothetical protein